MVVGVRGKGALATSHHCAALVPRLLIVQSHVKSIFQKVNFVTSCHLL